MLPIQFTYLFGASLFIVPWLAIYWLRKDLRKPMITIGLMSILPSLIAGYFWWSRDWWYPETITGTVVGIEDVLLAFTSTGVAACLYPAVFRKSFRAIPAAVRPGYRQLLLLLTIFLALFSLLYWAGVTSFMATLCTFGLASAYMLSQRKDLVLPAITTSVLLVILVMPVYAAMLLVTPNFVADTWFTENLLGAYIIGVPIEEYAFYLIGGILCFLVWPYHRSEGVVPIEVQAISSFEAGYEYGTSQRSENIISE